MLFAISGRNYAELLKRQDPAGVCLKMLLGTSRWASTKCFLTWMPLATPARRLLFQLVPSEVPKDANGFGLLPTPNAQDYRRGFSMKSEQYCLTKWVAAVLGMKHGRRGTAHPNFICWLMGYPQNWTSLQQSPSETPSSRKSRRKSSGP